MPKQTKSQKTGSLGHSIVEQQIKRSELWIARNLNEDFGIDIELEYAPEDVKGKFVKAQIKAHKQIKADKDFIFQNLTKSYLRYCYECRIPIILIIVSNETSETWFIWLQKWIIDSDKIGDIYNESLGKSISIPVPLKNNFVIALDNEIVSIANWENTTQLYIALKDLANLSLQLYNSELSTTLFDCLEKFEINNPIDAKYIDLLIEKVLSIGLSIWVTNEGNKLSQLLFKFIMEHGDRLNINHVSKLVIRDNTCSRTGINALGVLYDNFPNHALSLKLTEKFNNFTDKRLHYYCTIREKYLNSKSPSWLLQTSNLTIGKLKVDFSPIKTDLYDKWANRGDSVILDYIFEVE
jgi:hypothetical protein